MKAKNSLITWIVLSGLLVLFNSCSHTEKNHDFIVPENHPATALTIGWYVPVDVMKQIVGPGFTPKVVHGEDETTVMLYIVKSDEHVLDSVNTGEMRAAFLVIPVESSRKALPSDGSRIENTLACPMTVIDQSKQLGDKFNAFGFPTYSGEITLNVKLSGDKYQVDATIREINGSIEIKAMFDKNGEEQKLNSAIFTTKQGANSSFYGKEKMTRVKNGKGNLKLDGKNIISAMQLNNLPYFLILDRNVTWAFDFVK